MSAATTSVKIKSKLPFWRQMFVVSGMAMSITGDGCCIGFPGVLLPQLARPDSKIVPSQDEASWIASIVGIAIFVGVLLMPVMMEKFGRKISYIYSLITMIVGWITVAVTPNVTVLITARFVQGFAMGLQALLGPIIIGEYTSHKNRGAFLGVISLSLASGMLISHVIGMLIYWRIAALILSLFSVISLIIICFSPESPSWLASKGRFEQSQISFRWLRGETEAATKEFEALITAQKINFKNKENKNKYKKPNSTIHLFLVFGKKEVYKPSLIMMNLFIMFHFAGTNVLPSYCVDIMKAIVDEKGDRVYYAMLIIDLIRAVAAVVACYIVRKINRRTALFISALSTKTCLVSISFYVYFKSNGYIALSHNWIPIVLLGVYEFALSIGIIPITWTIAGEIFPLHYKSLGGMVSGTLLSVMSFGAVKSAPSLFAAIGVHGAFLCYAGIVAICSFNLYFIMPETKGKTLLEIEEFFTGKKYRIKQPDDTRLDEQIGLDDTIPKNISHGDGECFNALIVIK